MVLAKKTLTITSQVEISAYLGFDIIPDDFSNRINWGIPLVGVKSNRSVLVKNIRIDITDSSAVTLPLYNYDITHRVSNTAFSFPKFNVMYDNDLVLKAYVTAEYDKSYNLTSRSVTLYRADFPVDSIWYVGDPEIWDMERIDITTL
ncbi:MAG: hypothetical protein QXO37_02505 [Candidatus Nitrosocaldaceae archaeon]